MPNDPPTYNRRSTDDLILTSLGKIEGTQTQIVVRLDRMDERMNKMDDRDRDNESQIGSVKTKIAFFTGIGSAVGFLLSKLFEMIKV